MLKKSILFVLVFLSLTCCVYSQGKASPAGSMKPAFQQLALNLSTTYFTVVKETQVDLDSSLIHVSKSLQLSRLQVVAYGINDKYILSRAQWVDERKPLVGEQQLTAAKGQQHIALLILLGAYYAFEPGNDSVKYIKAWHYLNDGITESKQLNDPLLQLAGERLLGKLYLKKNDFANADKLFTATMDGYVKAGETDEAAKTCSWWSLYAPVTPTSTPARIKHTEMALQLFRSVDDKEGQINDLMNESYLRTLMYDLTDACKLEKQSLSLSETTGFPYRQYITGALLSITMFQGKFGEPLSYDTQAIEQAETLRDSIGLPYFYDMMSQLYNREANERGISINWGVKAINVFLKQHEPCYQALIGIVDVYLSDGRQGEAIALINKVITKVPPVTKMDEIYYHLSLGKYYTYKRNWAVAQLHLNKAGSIAADMAKHGVFFDTNYMMDDYASFYFNKGDYKKAKVYYKQALHNPDVHGLSILNAMTDWHSLVIIDSVEGNKDAELKDYAQYMNAVNSNYTVSKTRQAEELQVKYATAEKTNQINALNQRARLEQANLEKANVVKNVTIAGIVLLIIIALLLYRQNQMKQRNSDLMSIKNQLMEKLLAEKEWLVKEVHHRVKNNLHTIICLLDAQANYLQNDALKAIQISQHRVYSMSLIHQKLYQSDDVTTVDIALYLREFISYLADSFGTEGRIIFNLEVQPLRMSVAQAIPIALIVNEAITNAIKYAFPDTKKGEITIVLKEQGGVISLDISDNGIGIDEALIHQQSESLGLVLIKGLTSDLKGTLEIKNNYGTIISIVFSSDRIFAG